MRRAFWRRLDLRPSQLGVPAIAVILSCVASVLMTGMRTTAAGLSDYTANLSNNWTAGQVVLTDDDGGSAAFSTGSPQNDGQLIASQTLTRCIVVTYTGSWTATQLTDTFSSQDNAKWFYASGAAINSNALQLTPTTLFPEIRSQTTYDFRDAVVTAEVPQVLNVGNGTTQVFLDLRVDTNNGIRTFWDGGTNSLYAQEKVGGVATTTNVAYNSTNQRWWRIKTVGTTVYWQYSSDNSTWVTLRTKTTAVPLSSMQPKLIAGYTGTEPSPGTARFDNFTLTTSVGAGVRMYGTASGSLTPYITLTVERGSGGIFGNCTGFVAEATLYSGALDTFTSTYTDYSSGIGGWGPTTSPTSRTYRIATQMSSNPAAAGLTATGTFTWEAQTT